MHFSKYAKGIGVGLFAAAVAAGAAYALSTTADTVTRLTCLTQPEKCRDPRMNYDDKEIKCLADPKPCIDEKYKTR